MAILTFLESHDFSGKTVIPFCTHGGGGSGSSVQSIKSSATEAVVLEGFSISGSRAESALDDVIKWIDGLNLH